MQNPEIIDVSPSTVKASLIDFQRTVYLFFFLPVLVFRKTQGLNICHLLYFPGS